MSKRKKNKDTKMNGTESNGSAGSAVADVDTSSSMEEQEEVTSTEASGQDSETNAAEATGESSAVEPVETSLDPIDELEKELAAVRDLARRKQAEFENYRKRVERERSDIVNLAAVNVVTELLPVLDNLERAIDASEAGTEDNFREGVQIIYKQFRDVLTKQGLEEVAALNEPFDPHFHEAVGRVETDEHPEGTVLEILRKGYRMKERLIQAAMVTVSVGSEASSDNEDEADSEAEDAE